VMEEHFHKQEYVYHRESLCRLLTATPRVQTAPKRFFGGVLSRTAAVSYFSKICGALRVERWTVTETLCIASACGRHRSWFRSSIETPCQAGFFQKGVDFWLLGDPAFFELLDG
jgi:hypothetical protein